MSDKKNVYCFKQIKHIQIHQHIFVIYVESMFYYAFIAKGKTKDSPLANSNRSYWSSSIPEVREVRMWPLTPVVGFIKHELLFADVGSLSGHPKRIHTGNLAGEDMFHCVIVIQGFTECAVLTQREVHKYWTLQTCQGPDKENRLILQLPTVQDPRLLNSHRAFWNWFVNHSFITYVSVKKAGKLIKNCLVICP